MQAQSLAKYSTEDAAFWEAFYVLIYFVRYMIVKVDEALVTFYKRKPDSCKVTR